MHRSRLSSLFSLCGLLGFCPRPSFPRNMVTACTTLEKEPAALARPQTRQESFLAPQPCIVSLRLTGPQLLDGLQALASLPTIIC